MSFAEFKEKVLADPEAKKYYEELTMKTYCFTVKHYEEYLISFSIESKSLMDAVYSSQFIKELENLDFFDSANLRVTLYSSEWTCFSLQEGVKGFFTEETFDIKFEAKKTWVVN